MPIDTKLIEIPKNGSFCLLVQITFWCTFGAVVALESAQYTERTIHIAASTGENE
jgi:hypothetical protein